MFGLLYKTKNKIILFVLDKICIIHLYVAFWFSAVTVSVNNKDKTKKEHWYWISRMMKCPMIFSTMG